MNDGNHHQVVELAIPALPERSRDFWTPMLPQITATCLWPDIFAIPLLNGEDGPWRRYFPAETPKHSFEKHGAAAREHFFDIRFYIAHLVTLLQQEDWENCCRCLGVFSHYLGDFSEQAHFYEDGITLLLPPPPDRINCNPHRMVEEVNSTLAAIAHQPCVLGDTIDTIVMRLEGRLRELYETSLASIIPILSALYQRDAAAAERWKNPVVAGTAAVMADVLHTLWCLHAGVWSDDERKALLSVRLDALEPAGYDVEFNYGFRPIRSAITLDQIGHAIPLQLRFAGEIQAVEGLCLVPHALPIAGTEYRSAVEFNLPPGAFNRFTSVVGLLAGFTPQARCRFTVETDGKTLYQSPEVSEEHAAIPIELDITDRQRLCLVVHTDGSTDKLAFPIWGLPGLTGREVSSRIMR